MPKIIVNSRYFHVARPGEVADGKHSMIKDAVSALVNYVATRETVSLNIAPDYQNNPVTDKQKNVIDDIVKTMPEIKNTFEFEDYVKNPTVINASELISRFEEMNYGMSDGEVTSDTAENLVEYVAKRPGVVKVGEHGLFGAENDVDLAKVQDELSNHKGNIWTHVVSLRREDADKLGYDSQKLWKEAVKSQLQNIAKQHNIKPENLRWYAGMHNTGHHPHIHLFVYSTDPKEGYIDADGINKIKSGFSKHIFKNEAIYSQEFYEDKDMKRQALKEKASEIIKNLPNANNDAFTPEQYEKITSNLLQLSDYLKGYNGRAVYAYISKDAKALVNNIVDELAECKDIQNLYSLWCDDKLLQMQHYAKDKIKLPKISEAEDFQSIKNNVIAYAKGLNANDFNALEMLPEADRLGHMPQEENGLNTEDIDQNEQTFLKKSPENTDNRYDIGDIFDVVDSTDEPHRNSITDYANEPDVDDFSNVAQKTETDPLGHMPQEENGLNTEDIDQNEQTFLKKSPENDDNQYDYDIGEIYDDIDTADEPYHDARLDMPYIELTGAAEAGDGWAAYKLGKMYMYGRDDKKMHIEKDIDEARRWFTIGAAKDANIGNALCQYELGKMDLYGKGIEKDPEVKQWGYNLINRAYKSFTYQIEEKGQPIYESYTGLFKENSDTFEVYKVDEDTAYLEYLCGRIKYFGELGEGGENYNEAYRFFTAAAINGCNKANYNLGTMYYYGKGLSQDYKKAFDKFDECAGENGKKHAYAAVKLAQMYRDGIGTQQDDAAALKLYEAAAEKEISTALYALGKIYAEGNSVVEKDEAKSYENYAKALKAMVEADKQDPNSKTEIQIGSMYAKGKGTEVNKAEAAKWYKLAADNGDANDWYRVARLFEYGEDVESDTELANEYYAKALESFLKDENKSADTQLKIADMYYSGKGTEVNKAEAADRYIEAAVKSGRAAYTVAKMFDMGDGVEPDPERAESAYKIALIHFTNDEAKDPNVYTESHLASMYYNGKGTEVNKPEAAKWYKVAADNGDNYALQKLAYMYDTGDGIDVDKELAYEYYSKALKAFEAEYERTADPQLACRIAGFYEFGHGTERDIDKALDLYKIAAEGGDEYAAQRIEAINDYQNEHIRAAAVGLVKIIAKALGNNTGGSHLAIYKGDSKIRRRQKIQKMLAGQQAQDNYDMDYYLKNQLR